MTKEIHKEKHLSHPKYRPDIDGLRAVAILLVVFFHAFNLHGGFIGVDIFFVISGFLISTIIFNNLDSGNFSFREFYARRVKRIFPALILVLAFCLIFGWFVLFDQEYRQLGYHVFRGSIFIINFQLLKESGYFDNAAELKPLLHLWSLSVEEQFYIIWPLILFIVYKAKSKPKSKLFIASIVIFITSFVFSVFSLRHNASGAFYLPYSRFWEMMLGAILAYYNIYKANSFNNFKNKISAERPQNFLSAFGVILIVIGVLVIQRNLFPGEWALLPTLGAAFIIAGKDGWFNKNILQNKILVWFGLISYPLYLWHWPLLSFAKIIEDGNLSFLLRVIIVVLSIILAWLTYYFVEKPIRFGKQKHKTIFLCLMIVVIALAGYFCKKTDGFPQRSVSVNANLFLEDSKISFSRTNNFFCADKVIKEFAGCSFVDKEKFPDSIIIGDSHSQALYVALQDKYKQNGRNLAIINTGGFPMFFDLIAKDNLKDERHTLEVSKVTEKIIMDSRIKEIILINRGTLYTLDRGFGNFDTKTHRIALDIDGNSSNISNEKAFEETMFKTLLKLTEAKKKIIYVNSVPDLGFNIKACLNARPFRIFSKPRNPCAVVKSEYDQYSINHKNLVNKVLDHFPNVKVINLSEAVCDNELCYGMMNNKLLYEDDNHLSANGAKLVSEKLGNEFLEVK